MTIRRYHLDKESIHADHLSKDVQWGRASVSFPFAVAGEENVSATITFPKAFPSPPVVLVSIEGIDVGVVKVTTTAKDFSVAVRDDKGVDYTSAQTATVHWIAFKA